MKDLQVKYTDPLDLIPYENKRLCSKKGYGKY